MAPADSDSARLRESLGELKLNQSAFAGVMSELGDSREMKTILRSIQRMAGDEARLSGEMHVILTLLKREQSRARRMMAAATWVGEKGQRQWTEIQGVRVTINPETKGRWSIYATHVAEGSNGYSPEMPHWRNSEEDAKLRAVLAVDETLDDLELIAAQAAA